MAKSVAEADKKSINLAQEIYVHYNKQNYLDYKKQHGLIINIEESLNSIYMGYAKEIAQSMRELRKLTNKDGQNLTDMLGLINEINGKSSVYTDMSNEIATEVADIIRAGIPKSIQISKGLSLTNDVKKELKFLDDYIKYIKDAINVFNRGNADLFKYILSKYDKNSPMRKNITQLFSVGRNKLNLLAINKTDLTSYNNLKKKLEQLEEARNSLQSTKKHGVINYEGKTISYASFIFSLKQTFVNILGGIGEGFGAIYALRSLEDFLKTLDREDMKVTVEGTGTEKAEEGSTKKADYSISINSDSGDISLSFGISAKAQALKRGKPVTTTFETTRLKNLLNKYTQLTNIEKYIFYNDLYSDMTRTAESQYLRRKIAAQAMLDAVTGKQQGENVLFLQYLDELISMDDFFMELAKLPENSSSLPSVNILGAKKIRSNRDFIKRGKKLTSLIEQEGYNDLDPNDKSIVAWVRSRQVIKSMNELMTQIQYKH